MITRCCAGDLEEVCKTLLSSWLRNTKKWCTNGEWKEHWPAGAEQLRDHQSVSPALCCPYSQRPPGPDTSSKQTKCNYIRKYSPGFSHRLVIKSDLIMKVTAGCLNNTKTITHFHVFIEHNMKTVQSGGKHVHVNLDWITGRPINFHQTFAVIVKR